MLQNQQDRNDLTTSRQIKQQNLVADVRKKRRKYGNVIVFCQKPCLLTLGPDYLCFLPTFIIFCIVSYFMVNFVLNNSTNIYFRIITIFVCGGTCLAYLLIATSNPGIVTEQDLTDTQQQENTINQENMNRKKSCKKCNIRVKRTTRHCNDCDVCIQQYDHHCPWTSKCIGGGNLKRFYFFLGMVPTFFIYVFVAFAILASQIALANTKTSIKINQ